MYEKELGMIIGFLIGVITQLKWNWVGRLIKKIFK